MNKNRKIGITIWFITFALAVLLLLLTPESITSSVVVTLIFDGVVYISVLILWLILFRNADTPKDIFYCSPAIAVSAAYLLIQLIVSIIIGLLVAMVPLALSLIINSIIMVVMWSLILLAIVAKNHAKHVNSRQKDNHVRL